MLDRLMVNRVEAFLPVDLVVLAAVLRIKLEMLVLVVMQR
jgi:hypothetical protein